jgi:hypothetical protein
MRNGDGPKFEPTCDVNRPQGHDFGNKEGWSRGVTITTKFSRQNSNNPNKAGSRTAGLSAAFPLLDPAPRGFSKESGENDYLVHQESARRSIRSSTGCNFCRFAASFIMMSVLKLEKRILFLLKAV